ncbi:MAG: haloacid dehalogenase type II [Gammaproteobacteria bacterium]|nr:haloacid dehalogenase type II [Gammaproteobacteria bacterium]
MSRVIIFDVNETLLDLRGLDVCFKRYLRVADVRKEWFAQALSSAMVATITDAYSDFGRIGGAALEMIAQRHQLSLSDDARAAILGAMRTLPPHAEAPDALARLRDQGLRLGALTNSTAQTAQAQLKHAGLYDFFEQILSAHAVRRLKPAPEPYLMAARAFDVDASNVRLVAAHSWDVIGAMRAGCRAAFVARPGMVLDPLAERPDIVGADLGAVADSILKMDVR